MSLRRILVVLLILCCATLWRPISLLGMGAAARLYLHVQKGWDCSYGSMEWTERGVEWRDVSVSDGKGFSLSAPWVLISFGAKYLEIDRPLLTLSSLPSIEDDGWKAALRNGVLRGDGVEEARFSLVIDDAIHAQIQWEEGSIAFDAALQEGLWSIDASLERLSAQSIKGWLSDGWQGVFTGKIHGEYFDGAWRQTSGHLEGEGVSLAGLFDGVAGAADWSGDCFHWQDRLRLRLQINEGNVFLLHSPLHHVKGALSLIEGAGAKWEWDADLNGKALRGLGRGFMQSVREAWVESDLRCGSEYVSVQGVEGAQSWCWDVLFETLSTDMSHVLRGIAAALGSPAFEGTLCSGTVSGRLKAISQGSAISNWEIVDAHGSALSLQKGDVSFSCERCDIHQGAYSFQGARFSIQDLQGEGWGGYGAKGVCSLAGRIGDFHTTIEMQGTSNAFTLRALADGWVDGGCVGSGGWDGTALHLALDEARAGDFRFKGRGWVDREGRFFWGSEQFSGPLETVSSLVKTAPISGTIQSTDKGFAIGGSLLHLDAVYWQLQAVIREASAPLFGTARLGHLSTEVEADHQGISFYNTSGSFIWGKEFRFHSPILQTNGAFDVRVEGEKSHLLRLAGTTLDGNVSLDGLRSHLMGAGVCLSDCSVRGGEIQSLKLEASLPWVSLASISDLPVHYRGAPLIGDIAIRVAFSQDAGAAIDLESQNLKWGGEATELSCHLHQEQDGWRITPSSLGCYVISGGLLWENERLRLVDGRGTWKEGIEATLDGWFDSLQKGSLQLTNVRVELGAIAPMTAQFLPLPGEIRGVLEGSGILSWEKELEADFDFSAPHLQVGPHTLENRAPIHLYYSSERGILVRGIDFAMNRQIDGKIGLLQYDLAQSRWAMVHSHLHIPAAYCQKWIAFSPFLERHFAGHTFDFTADIECSADFSSGFIALQEGLLPFDQQVHRIENLSLHFTPQQWFARFDLAIPTQTIKIACSAALGSQISGRLEIQDSLSIDWAYADKLSILAIDGSFAGVDASFHSEGETLIGSARVDFTTLSEIIPAAVGSVFQELEMGKGYELMGRLKIDPAISFHGILGGKQLELFGFQLRTLLAEVEISLEKVRLRNIKISDSGGVMTMDEISIQGSEHVPWTLSIPHLRITELRPALLQKIGEPPKAMSPLVVRRLEIGDVKGVLADPKSYSAKGELSFINSYKREHTVFDIPSDVLSRIVGLDLDLLIPVQGILRFELKDGYFWLTELENSFSENKRSQFFLVKDDNSPRMALNGDLSIFIQMKQFVIFKFTESFVISVDGKLGSPKFHLQKKKRFLGL